MRTGSSSSKKEALRPRKSCLTRYGSVTRASRYQWRLDPSKSRIRTEWTSGLRKFGLRWFVPELLKHKRVWRDVLSGSLVLQLMGLALPLFTQVVIDKVVVHRTSSTLIALGIAMAMFVVFTGVLSWVRQYLILHTGQRIDAVLGSRVFDRPRIASRNFVTGCLI